MPIRKAKVQMPLSMLEAIEEFVRAPGERGVIAWNRIVELGRIAAGEAPGRAEADGITLLGSLGIAIEDHAPARCVYEGARAGHQRRNPALVLTNAEQENEILFCRVHY